MKIKRRTLTSLKIWGLRVLVAAVLLVIFFVYTRTSIFTITSYTIEGVSTTTQSVIDTQLREFMKQPVYLVIPGNKMFTYNTGGVTSIIRGNVPDMGSIEMRPVGLHTLHITITLLEPFFRTEDGQVITKDGFVFRTFKDTSNLLKISIASSTMSTIKVKGVPFQKLSTGDGFFEEGFYEGLLDFASKVSRVIFSVDSIVVEKTGDIVLMNASGTTKLFFLKDTDKKKVWSTLVSAIDTVPLKTKLDTEREKLEYLDVRYGNKVFYRFSDMPFQNNGTTAILDGHATSTPTITEASTTPQ